MTPIDPASSTRPSLQQTDALRTARWIRLLDRTGRGLLCALIVIVVFYCLGTVRDIRSTEQAAETARKSPPAQPVFISNLIGGRWQFGGLPWSVQVRDVEDAELALLLNSAVEPLTAPAADENDDLFTSVLESLDAAMTVEGGHAVYRVDRPGLQIVAFAPQDAPRQVQRFRVAHAASELRWNLIDAVRREALPSNGDPIARSPVPYAPEDRQLAFRVDEGGAFCAELVDLSIPFLDLLSLWASAGWQVLPFDLSADSTTPATAAQTAVLCRNDSQSVIALLIDQSTDDFGMLLVVRSP